MSCGHAATVSHISTEFKTDAKYTFNLLHEAELGQPVLKTDVIRSLARLDAEANTSDEKAIRLSLEGYRAFLQHGNAQRLSACKATYELLMGDEAMAKIDDPSVTRNSCSDAWDDNTKEIVAQVQREQDRSRSKQKRVAIASKPRACITDLDTGCTDSNGVFHPMGRPRQ